MMAMKKLQKQADKQRDEKEDKLGGSDKNNGMPLTASPPETLTAASV